MKKSIWCVILCVCFCVSCQSKHELNDLVLASAVSIDKEGNSYSVTVQIVNPDSVRAKKSEESPVFTYMGKGVTIDQAVKEIEHQLPRYLFLSDVRLFVLSQEVARSELNHIIDFLLRSPRIRSDFLFLVSKDLKASDALNVITPIDEIPAEFVYRSLKNYVGGENIYQTRTLNGIVREMSVKDIILPGIKNEGAIQGADKEEKMDNSRVSARLVIEDIALFKNNRFQGWATEKELEGMSYFYAQKNEQHITLKIPNCADVLSVRISKPAIQLEGRIENGRGKIEVNLHVTSSIRNISCPLSERLMKKIQKETEEEIKRRIAFSVRSITKKYHSDVFGFGWVLKRSQPLAWEKFVLHDEKWLERVDITVNVNVTSEGTGQILNPLR